MGVSENSVPHCTQWLMIIIPITNGYFIGNINPTFSVTNPDRSRSLGLWASLLKVYDRWAPEGKVQRKTDRQGGLARARAFETPTQRPNGDLGILLCSEIEICQDLPEILRDMLKRLD